MEGMFDYQSPDGIAIQREDKMIFANPDELVKSHFVNDIEKSDFLRNRQSQYEENTGKTTK